MFTESVKDSRVDQWFQEVPKAIPVVGVLIADLVRSGSSMGQATLTRCHSPHTFVLPWLIVVFMLLHLLIIRK